MNKKTAIEYTRKRKDEVNMNEEYKKETKIIEKNEQEKEVEFIRMIIKTREELKCNNQNFESATEGLIDYYVYQIKANQSKLDYLIKLAKLKGIEVDMITDKQYSNFYDEAI